MSFSDFKHQVEAAGLQAVDHGRHHWQICGGNFKVNFYPRGMGYGTIYVSGMHFSQKSGTVREAIAMVNKIPDFTDDKAPRKKQGWRKCMKRWCWEETHQCHWCKKELDFATATLDHVIPRARGGNNGKGNIVLACWQCNYDRGSDMPEFSNNNEG